MTADKVPDATVEKTPGQNHPKQKHQRSAAMLRQRAVPTATDRNASLLSPGTFHFFLLNGRAVASFSVALVSTLHCSEASRSHQGWDYCLIAHSLQSSGQITKSPPVSPYLQKNYYFLEYRQAQNCQKAGTVTKFTTWEANITTVPISLWHSELEGGTKYYN